MGMCDLTPAELIIIWGHETSAMRAGTWVQGLVVTEVGSDVVNGSSPATAKRPLKLRT